MMLTIINRANNQNQRQEEGAGNKRKRNTAPNRKDKHKSKLIC